MKRETIKALEVRRNSVLAERRKSQMQTLGANNHNYSGLNNNIYGRNHRSSTAGSVRNLFGPPNDGGIVNNAYEGTISEDEHDRTSVRMDRNVVFRQ